MAESIFAKALEVASPGFDALLNVIQTETNRIEQNRALAQQREAQLDMLELKAEYDIEIYNETTGKQQEANRQLQRDLAQFRSIEEAIKEKAEEEDEIHEKTLEEKKRITENLRTKFSQRYQPLIDSGFLIPKFDDIKVAQAEDGDGLQGYYQLSSGEYITPEQYEKEYGWAARAEGIVEQYMKTKDNLRETTREEGVQNDSILETVFGGAVDLSTVLDEPEIAKESISRKYLSRSDAAEKIAQLRNGNQQVLRQFELGLLQFNDRSKFDAEVAPEIRSDIKNVTDFLEGQVNVSPGVWGFFENRITPTETDTTSFGVGFAKSLGLKTNQVGIRGGLTVDKITEFISDNADESVVQRWNRLLDKYPRLDNARRNTPWSKLFVNPYFTDDTPLSDFFVTKDKLKRIEQKVKPQTGTDEELGQEWIQTRQSQQILNQALNN